MTGGIASFFAMPPILFLKLSKDCYTDFMHPIMKLTDNEKRDIIKYLHKNSKNSI